MKDLRKLEEQYKRLGDEIEALKQSQGLEIIVPELKLKIIFADETMTWQDAQDWCQKQGGRLPTILELKSLADSGQVPEDKRKFYYWTSEPVSQFAWVVYLNRGNTLYNAKVSFDSVLCVKD